ncbi:jg22762 [Pararge aegeria aegeria]|uniref:Jg22762 protein n=1 Tax=Pararge aegeria aegeria TaxID=348720 RepID=A0A8S4QZV2_9NEOP|nr:jg22762 [Pararge aegeria aegeria]
MTYASVVFAHRPHSSYRSFQVLQNKFMRMTTDSPWYMRNVDLHRDLDLPTIAQYMKTLSKTYFENAVRHPNPLVVEASTPVPDVEPKRRRPKHVLDDPDDKITTDNVSQQHTHTFLTSSGRGSLPRSRGRSD